MNDNHYAFQKLVDDGYNFDFNRYISEGFAVFKQYAGGFIGFYAIAYPVIFIISYYGDNVGSAITNVLQIAISAGTLLVINEVFRKNTPQFSKFFEGFKFMLPLLLLGLVSGIFIVIGLVFLIVPGIYLAVSYYFAQYFIIFLGYDFWSAMELSRKIVAKNWWNIFGFVIVLALINVAGFLACGIGILFTAPATLCMSYVAFEDIVGGAIRRHSVQASVNPIEFEESQSQTESDNPTNEQKENN
jgi:hypothetical protein